MIKLKNIPIFILFTFGESRFYGNHVRNMNLKSLHISVKNDSKNEKFVTQHYLSRTTLSKKRSKLFRQLHGNH